jgi:plasmid stabilization system protein ParE
VNIIKDEIFVKNLKQILKYITQDSKVRARKFNNDLFVLINNLTNMPLKFRKSYYHNHDNTRDLIFKGYTIPYLIDEANNVIILLDIFKWSKR